jgi:putative transposase
MRELINAIFFVLRDCPWRMLPEHFPPHQTAYRWFTRFRDVGPREDLQGCSTLYKTELIG